MNAKGQLENQSSMKDNNRRVSGALALLLFLPVAAWAGGVVTNCTEVDLRAAMTGGGTVTFACNGTITLANTISNSLDTVFDASGHQVTISGNGSVRVFYVNSNVDLTLINLTVANGGSNTLGAGIFNAGGTVNLVGVAFATNAAWGTLSTGGGAIRNELGTLNLQNCSFTGNSANGSRSEDTGPGGEGLGGAIYNNGTMNANACTFFYNSAEGGGLPWSFSYGIRPQDGGNGAGGAVYNLGVAVLDGCTFVGNVAGGCSGTLILVPFQGSGAQGGWGAGGAICNLGQLIVRTSSFLTNNVLGGSGGNGGCDYMSGFGSVGGAAGSARGGTLYSTGTVSIASSTFVGNRAAGGSGGDGGGGYAVDFFSGAPGGSGGAASLSEGAVVFNTGSMVLVNCTMAQNTAVGGSGGKGGPGAPGLWLNGSVGPGGNGGNGGAGGSACGFIASYGQLKATNCTFASNSAQAGSGGNGGDSGSGNPPGAHGNPGPNGTAQGSCSSGWQLLNTLLSSNAPANSSGTITDAGHNLSSDASCAFTNSSSHNNTDAGLGPLADNGGPTLTMALPPGSPAIDAGDTVLAPATDQRGFPRPAGLAADIGAFEYGWAIPTLAISRSGAASLNILASGNANLPCRLLSSADCSNWVPIATNQVGSDGTVLFYDTCPPGSACRFYRLVMP